MNFQKLQLKRKIVKHFARPKQRRTLRILFSLPPFYPSRDKTLLRLWIKKIVKEIYRNIQRFAFKVLQECSSRNGAVQISFLTPNRNMFTGKFVKLERFLAVLREHIIFNVKWVVVCKMSQIFRAKLYCKMCSLFC